MAARFTETSRHLLTVFGLAQIPLAHVVVKRNGGLWDKVGEICIMPRPGQERFTRLKTLGADYTEEAIRERIAGRRAKAAKAPREQRGVSLLIDIENSINLSKYI